MTAGRRIVAPAGCQEQKTMLSETPWTATNNVVNGFVFFTLLETFLLTFLPPFVFLLEHIDIKFKQ